jgi:hypothetical protein
LVNEQPEQQGEWKTDHVTSVRTHSSHPECSAESRSSKSSRKRTKGWPDSESWFDWERRRVESPATNERCLKEGASVISGNVLLVGAVVLQELCGLYISEEENTRQ